MLRISIRPARAMLPRISTGMRNKTTLAIFRITHDSIVVRGLSDDTYCQANLAEHLPNESAQTPTALELESRWTRVILQQDMPFRAGAAPRRVAPDATRAIRSGVEGKTHGIGEAARRASGRKAVHAMPWSRR